MTDVSDYLAGWVLDEAFTGERHVALFKTSNGEIIEVSAADYERQPVILTASGDSVRTSQNGVSFLAASTWGEVTHIGLCDSSTGGNVLVQRKLDNAIDVHSGSQLDIDSGDLSVHKG